MANLERPISRYDCCRFISEVLERVFSYSGERPQWGYHPVTHSPRLALEDIDVLERHLLECLSKCRERVQMDKHKPLVVFSPTPKESCPCCGDDGRGGAKNWEMGHCQRCRAAGCLAVRECVRPPEHESFYHPGDDAPQGWGPY